MPVSLVAAVVAVSVVSLVAAPQRPPAAAGPVGGPSAPEPRLRNITQLTFGGENAEAYFSPDGKQLIFQATRDGAACDQMYVMNVDGRGVRRLSSGAGRTTCGYFTPDGKQVVYASTHAGGAACPPRPSYERGYVWPVYDTYDIYAGNVDGTGLRALTTTPGYDAEATIAPDGRIAFTSTRDGDMEIYSMAADGSDVKRLTSRPGPDGGPFWSRDGRRIVFRGRAIAPGAELDDYRSLLKQGLWRPTSLELFVMDRDGSNLRQVTKNGAANFAPYFTPDGTQIIFATNHPDPRGRNFDLYVVNVDGTGLEQVTFNATFDGFPMFSPDGTKIVFASNRHAAREGDTNVFIADWVPAVPK
jgi:Tol biopolymer transport system component